MCVQFSLRIPITPFILPAYVYAYAYIYRYAFIDSCVVPYVFEFISNRCNQKLMLNFSPHFLILIQSSKVIHESDWMGIYKCVSNSGFLIQMDSILDSLFVQFTDCTARVLDLLQISLLLVRCPSLQRRNPVADQIGPNNNHRYPLSTILAFCAVSITLLSCIYICVFHSCYCNC